MTLSLPSSKPLPQAQGAEACPKALRSCFLAGSLGCIIGRFLAQSIFSSSQQLVKHLVRALVPGQRRPPVPGLWSVGPAVAT